jgi:hypothetical protein
MLTAIKPQSKRSASRAPAVRKTIKKLFWVRPGHPDLDRAGNFLLTKGDEIRLESKPRGAVG